MASVGVEAAESPVKQCITVLDKKIRNLEKRKGKLDQYRQSLKNTELNKDQKEALAKYDVVLQNIDFAKELQKQFFEISADTEKAQKKTAKREKMERHQLELLRLQDVLRLNSILNALGNDNVREDFRVGRNISLVLTDDQLSQLDDCYQIFFPSREVDQTEEVFGAQLSSASDHLVCYIDRQDKKVSNTTYKELHVLIDRIGNCGYFDRLSKVDPEIIQPSEETPAVDEHYEEQSVVESKTVVPEETLDLADGANPDALCDASRSVGQPEHYRWSHSPVLATQQPAVMATTAGVIAMATAQGDRPQSSGFSDGAYYSGFAKQRPLQEIVSSLQGSYNFLQESQIDAEGGHAQGQGHAPGQGQSDVVYNSSYDNQSASGHPSLPPFNAPQQQTTPIDQSGAIHASQPHFDHDPSQPGAPIYPGSTSGGAYGVQGLHNVYGHHQMSHEPGYDPNYGQIDKTQYNFMDQQTFVLSQMNPGGDPTSHVVGMNVGSAAGPQPIPLPSQAIHGRSLTEQGFGASQQSAEMSEAMAKKQFTMNPNADIFRSVYDESSALPSGDHMKPSEIPPQSVGDGQLRTFAQTAGANFQVGGASRGFGSSFGSGGPPRGSGPSRGGRGGKDPVFNNGIQSGGRGGGPNQGTAGQRGGTRGVPPRGGNSHVRGGGGGGGRGGFGRNSEQQSSHEQATHA